MKGDAQRLLNLIVRHIRSGRFTPGDARTYLGYKEVHDLAALSKRGGTWGRSLQRQGLSDLAAWIKENGLPAITGLIVSTIDRKPGPGYFGFFPHTEDDEVWWQNEVRRAISYDWSAYAKEDTLPSPRELVDYETLYAEGKLHKVNARTRTRCEALMTRAKSYFRSENGELACQACGWSRPDKTLTGDIVEIHHLYQISALPQGGVRLALRDALARLLPLCPTCHRIAHAKPGGGTFTLDELKKMVGY